MMMKMVKIMKIVRLIETAPKSPNLVFTLFLTVENPLFWIWPSFKFREFNYCHQWPLIEFTIKLLFKFLDIWELQPQIVTQKSVTDEQTQSLKRSFEMFLDVLMLFTWFSHDISWISDNNSDSNQIFSQLNLN